MPTCPCATRARFQNHPFPYRARRTWLGAIPEPRVLISRPTRWRLLRGGRAETRQNLSDVGHCLAQTAIDIDVRDAS
jgi:hypothetical protein